MYLAKNKQSNTYKNMFNMELQLDITLFLLFPTRLTDNNPIENKKECMCLN